jgi:hypothetical protein
MTFDLTTFRSTLEPLLALKAVTLESVRVTDVVEVSVSYKRDIATITDAQTQPIPDDGGEAAMATDWAQHLG